MINTNKLLYNRINVNSAELVYLNKILRNNEKGLLENYQLIKKLPQDVFHAIWSTPESYLWSKITWDLVHSDLNNSKFLKNYLEWVDIKDSNQIKNQSCKLGLFVISGHILMKNDVTLPNVIKVSKIGSFPATGISWNSSEDFEILGLKNMKIQTRINENYFEFSIENQINENGENPFFFQPKIDDSSLKIDIWSECSRMDFDGMEWINRVSRESDIDSFRITLSKSLKHIKDYDKKIFDELSILLSKVVPLEPISVAAPSSSNSTMLGLVFCTHIDDPLLLAEMLIHECSHNKLFLFQEIDTILDSSVHGDGWSNENYYSPWRSDPRPLNGILHGIYVFSEVIKFWNYIIESNGKKDYDHISYKRFYLLVEQTRIALDILKQNASFTNLGNAFINSIDKKIESYRTKFTIKDLESTSAHFAELNHDPDLLGNNIIDAIKGHKRKWMNP